MVHKLDGSSQEDENLKAQKVNGYQLAAHNMDGVY